MESIKVFTDIVKLGLVDLSSPSYYIQIFNTLILYFCLRKFLFKPVTEFVQKRQDGIDSNIKDAEGRQKEAYEIKAQYEQKLAKAEDEGRHIIKEAAMRAETRATEIIREAEAEIQSMRAAAALELERERQVAMNALKDEIAHLTILAASKVVEKDMDEQAHRSFIQQFIEGVGDSKWQN